MPTSGTSAWNPAALYIITQAYRRIGVVNETETLSDALFQDGLFALNGLVKEFMASGIHIWTETEGILFLQAGQSQYLIGSSSTDHNSSADTYELTQVTTTALSGATSIVLDSVMGMTAADNIGIVLDDGSTHWTTISTIVSLTITFPLALTDSASSGNFVTTYTDEIVRPIRVPRARRFIFQGETETPLRVYSRKEYYNLPNKANEGPPTAFFYDPQLVDGQFFVWPTPSVCDSAIRITWYRPIQDFNDVNDTSDMPQEWLNTLVWNLAAEMAPGFDVPPQRYMMVKAAADQKLDLVRGWDREPEPIYFGYSEDDE